MSDTKAWTTTAVLFALTFTIGVLLGKLAVRLTEPVLWDVEVPNG